MASTDIKLNYINRSNDVNNSEIVVFQKNLAAKDDELSIAWLVIKNCGQGDNHPFVYPTQINVSASDSYGNFTPQLPAQNGQLFQMRLCSSGDELSLAGPGSSAKEVQVLNSLSQGAINASIYKNGKMLAQKTSIAPQQKAIFEFKPTLWVGVASQVEEGAVMDSAIISSIDTELSLLGVASADLVLTGGGSGSSSAPFEFNLENVLYCE